MAQVFAFLYLEAETQDPCSAGSRIDGPPASENVTVPHSEAQNVLLNPYNSPYFLPLYFSRNHELLHPVLAFHQSLPASAVTKEDWINLYR